MRTSKNEKYKDIEKRIESYFEYCDAVNEEKGKIVKPYTLSGLLCDAEMSREEFLKSNVMKLCFPRQRQGLKPL